MKSPYSIQFSNSVTVNLTLQGAKDLFKELQKAVKEQEKNTKNISPYNHVTIYDMDKKIEFTIGRI